MFVTRPWRNWIAHLIPSQKVVGSIPVGRAIRKGFNLKGQSLFSYQQFQPVRQQFQTNLIGLPFDLAVGMDPDSDYLAALGLSYMLTLDKAFFRRYD